MFSISCLGLGIAQNEYHTIYIYLCTYLKYVALGISELYTVAFE